MGRHFMTNFRYKYQRPFKTKSEGACAPFYLRDGAACVYQGAIKSEDAI